MNNNIKYKDNPQNHPLFGNMNRRNDFESAHCFPEYLPIKSEKVYSINENLENRLIPHEDYFKSFVKNEGKINSKEYCIFFSNKHNWKYNKDTNKFSYPNKSPLAFFIDCNWTFNIFYLDEKKELLKENHLSILSLDFGVNYPNQKDMPPTIMQIQCQKFEDLSSKENKIPYEKLLKLTKNVRWEKMLLQVAIDWAKDTGFYRIFVQSAENNIYCKIEDYDDSETIEEKISLKNRLKLRFDVLAKRMGFQYDFSSKNWVLDL